MGLAVLLGIVLFPKFVLVTDLALRVSGAWCGQFKLFTAVGRRLRNRETYIRQYVLTLPYSVRQTSNSSLCYIRRLTRQSMLETTILEDYITYTAYANGKLKSEN